MASSLLSSAITLFGTLTLAKLAYNTTKLLWIQFIRRSHLPKYLPASPSSPPSWALITGSTDGIGLELARELLSAGFNVYLHGRNPSKLAAVKASLLHEAHPDRRIETLLADATDPNLDYSALAQRVSSTPDSGPLKILINNAGGIPQPPTFSPLDTLPAENIDAQIALNARFPTRLTAALLPLLKSNSPSLVINAGSYAGVLGMPFLVTYTASKGYVHSFTRALRAEVEGTGSGGGSSAKGGVEVLGALIFDTATARNSSAEDGGGGLAGLMRVSANACARGILHKVGCGETLVAPDWRHWATANLMLCLPEKIARGVLFGAVEGRRREEVERLEGEGKKRS